MRLLAAKLKNFCQHRQLDVAFEPGVVGIFGPNGSGKSNLLNACYAGLTNDFSRTRGRKEETICQLAPPNEPAYVQTRWEHAGQEFTVRRGLRGASNRLELAGHTEKFSAVKEIEAELLRILRVPRQLLDRYVFVPQREMFAFLADDPAVRAKNFAYLCDTAKAEQLWALLGTQVASDAARAALEIRDNSDELRRLIAERRTKIARAQTELERWAPQLLDAAQLEEARQLNQQWTRYDALTSQLRVQRERLQSLQAEQQALQPQLQAARQEQQQTRAEQRRCEQLAQQAVAQLAVWKAHQDYARQQAAQAECRRQLAALREERAALVAPACREPQTVEELAKDLALSQAELSRQRQFLATFEQQGVVACPVCGTPTDALPVSLEEARQQLKREAERSQELIERQQTRQADDAAQRRWELKKSELGGKISAQEKAVKALPELVAPAEPAPADFDPTSVTKAERSAALAAANAYAADLNLQPLERQEQRLTDLVAENTEQGRQLMRLIEETKVEAVAAAQAEERLARHAEAEKETADLRAGLEHDGRLMAFDEAALEQLAAQLAAREAARKFVARLQAVREVFHRDRLPARVARRFLALLEDDVNGWLEEFESPFRVTTGESLSFTAHFTDGRVIAAEKLSPGQAGVLAVAYRGAINTLFAAELGLMCLDEPTEGLDEANLEHLEVALGKLSQRLRRGGGQILLVTHHRQLARSMDQVIDLGEIACPTP